MAPPTHPTGSEAYNSCGWHSGACVYPVADGPAMDWGYYNGSTYDSYVRFRGWFYRSGTGYSSGYVMLNVFQSASGDWVCDHTVADLWEILPWRVRYGMHYYHTYKAAGESLCT